jgi:hypothetical protein
MAKDGASVSRGTVFDNMELFTIRHEATRAYAPVASREFQWYTKSYTRRTILGTGVWVATPFYRTCSERQVILAIGAKPKKWKDLRNVSMQEQQRSGVRLNPQNPIHRASEFAECLARPEVKNQRQVAEIHGVSAMLVSNYLKLLALPQQVIDYLLENDTKEVRQYFSERKLRPIARSIDQEMALNEFQRIVAGIDGKQ